jgi:DNA-binding LacI/PurR family transcriptional regulator
MKPVTSPSTQASVRATSGVGPHSGINPTLAVVARRAGVSVPTVSKVINGRQDVALQTRRKVKEAIQNLGYVHKRRRDAQLPRLVDLMLPDLCTSRSVAVLHAAELAARAAGLEIVVSTAAPGGKDGRPRARSLDSFRARGTAGALFAAVDLSPSQHAWLLAHRIPYVLLDPTAAVSADAPTVTANDRAGAECAVKHLLALGHRRIAVMAGHQSDRRSTSHIAGYESTLDGAGIRVSRNNIRYAGLDAEWAQREMSELLNMPQPPSAVLICSDRMDGGVHRALQARGLKVRDDISVVSFEEHPADNWMTPFTAVRVPVAEMATTAMRALVRMINGENLDQVHIELPTTLVDRQSVGALFAA